MKPFEKEQGDEETGGADILTERRVLCSWQLFVVMRDSRTSPLGLTQPLVHSKIR